MYLDHADGLTLLVKISMSWWMGHSIQQYLKFLAHLFLQQQIFCHLQQQRQTGDGVRSFHLHDAMCLNVSHIFRY